MATIGPTLPPEYLTKRKRSSSSSSPTSPPAKRSRSSSPEPFSKQSRPIGAVFPPTNSFPEPPAGSPPNPKNPDNAHDVSSSDSDFGPSLPPSNTAPLSTDHPSRSSDTTQLPETEQPTKPQREDWMLAPPSTSDWTTRVDPTKLRARRFNVGKPSNPTPASRSGEIDSLWTETPEQKRRRLEDEVLGRKAVATSDNARNGAEGGAGDKDSEARRKQEEERRREMEAKVREFNEREGRGGSLYEDHQRKRDGRDKDRDRDRDRKEKKREDGKAKESGKERWQEEEDDPSKRVFDREKDIGLGGKIGYKARNDMTRGAKDFGGRFGKGGYL